MILVDVPSHRVLPQFPEESVFNPSVCPYNVSKVNFLSRMDFLIVHYQLKIGSEKQQNPYLGCVLLYE